MYADEAALGLTTTTADDLRNLLSGVPFAGAFLLVSAITARVLAAGTHAGAHLELARELCGDDAPILSKIGRFVAEHERAIVFAEQNCMILLRLIIEAATDVPQDRKLTQHDNRAIVRALIGTASISGMASDSGYRDARTPEDFLVYFIQNGAFNSERNPVGEIARSRELFERLAKRPDLQRNGCPIDEWMAEDYGLGVTEQFNLGFAISAITHAWNEDPGPGLYISPDKFDDLLLKLGLLDRRREALEIISATREELRAEFEEAGTSPAHLAWEMRPFMRHPCLRTENDGLVLTSFRTIQSWLTDGLYHRLVRSAERRSVEDGGRTSRRFRSFAGDLLEAYELEVMRSVLGGKRPPGGGRVYGEQTYGRKRGGKATSDVAVDLGQDLVLFEVSNSRVRVDTLVLGDNDGVKADLDRMIITKINQLDTCIDALLCGEARIPDFDIGHVVRIWPVVVTAGELFQTDEFWSYVDRESVGCLAQPKVQPLTLLDVEDFDQVCTLIENGYALHELLARKARPAFRRRELATWLEHDPGMPRETLPPKLVQATFDRAMARLVETTDFSQGIQAESEYEEVAESSDLSNCS